MTFDALLQSNDPFLKDLATKALRYKDEHYAGSLSDDAYAKLSAGLTDLQALNVAAQKEETRERLAEAVEAISQFLVAKL